MACEYFHIKLTSFCSELYYLIILRFFPVIKKNPVSQYHSCLQDLTVSCLKIKAATLQKHQNAFIHGTHLEIHEGCLALNIVIVPRLQHRAVSCSYIFFGAALQTLLHHCSFLKTHLLICERIRLITSWL